MGKNYRILVLEDDEHWLAKHTLKLKQAGFEPHPTQWGEEAKKFIREDTSLDIRGAIIDEILEDPKGSGGPQVVQGSEVVRYIKLKRSDVLCVMVTDVALKRSKNKEEVIGITEELKKASGVEIFHKILLEKDYNPLIGYLRNNIKPTPQKTAKVIFVIGIGQDKVYYVKKEHAAFRKRLNHCLVVEAEDTEDIEVETSTRKLEKLLKECEKQRIIIELKKPKPGEQGFDLLKYLSEQQLGSDTDLCVPKPVLYDILQEHGNTHLKDVRTRVYKIEEMLRQSANIPNELCKFKESEGIDIRGKEGGGWTMKFRVLNPYLILTKKQKEEEGNHSFPDD